MNRLLRFVARRLAVGIAQLAILTVAVFFLIRLLPADPVAPIRRTQCLAGCLRAGPAAARLDQSLSQQFAAFLGLGKGGHGLLEGRLGTSWVSGTPVGTELRAYLPVTLELITYSFLIAILIGVPIGVWGARRPGGLADKATLVYGLFAGSQPEFTWGLLFIYVFFVVLGVAPGPIGRLSPLTDTPPPITGALTLDALLTGNGRLLLESLWYLMLPVAVLAFVLSGPIIKMVRENMGRALRSEFVLYARACGLPEREISRGALRVAVAPAMTLIGVLYAFMIGGAVLVENVFSFSGIGQYAIRSILAFDYPAIQGVVLAIAAVSLLVYLPHRRGPRLARPAHSLMSAFGSRRLAPDPGNALGLVGLILVSITVILALFGPLLVPFDPTAASEAVSEAPPALVDLATSTHRRLDGCAGRTRPLVRHGRLGARRPQPHGRRSTHRSYDRARRERSQFRPRHLLGLVAGYFRNPGTELLMRISDVLQSFPVFISAMILVALAGRSALNIGRARCCSFIRRSTCA